MSALTTPIQINTFNLCRIRQLIKLERLGMKGRGPSALMQAKAILGLKKTARVDLVLEKLNELIEKNKAEMGIA